MLPISYLNNVLIGGNDLIDLIKKCNHFIESLPNEYEPYKDLLIKSVPEGDIENTIARDLNKTPKQAKAILQEIKDSIGQEKEEKEEEKEEKEKPVMSADFLRDIEKGIELKPVPNKSNDETETDDESDDGYYSVIRDLFINERVGSVSTKKETSKDNPKQIDLRSLSDSPEVNKMLENQKALEENQRKKDVEEYREYLDEKFKILNKNPDWDYKTATTEDIDYIIKRRDKIEDFDDDKFYIPKTPITDINDPKYQAALKAEKKHYLNATNKDIEDIEDIENKEWMDGGGARYKVKYN